MNFQRFKLPFRFSLFPFAMGIISLLNLVLLQSSLPNPEILVEDDLFLFDRIYLGEGDPRFIDIEKLGVYVNDLFNQSSQVKTKRPASFFGEGSTFPDEKSLATDPEYSSYNRIGYGYIHHFAEGKVRLYIFELRIFNREKNKFFSYCALFRGANQYKPAVKDLVENMVIPSLSEQKPGSAKKDPQSEDDTEEKFTVLIDPGHGGHNEGAVLPRSLKKFKVEEKDLNSQIARLTGDRLEKMGFTVLYTRIPEEDNFLSLNERTIISNIYKPDLFVSLHHDGGYPDSHGFRLFYSDYKPLVDVEDLQIFLNNKYESDRFLGEILINDLTYLFYRDKDGKIIYTTSELSNWDVLDKTLSVPAVKSKEVGEIVVKNFIRDLTYVKPHPKKGDQAIASAYFVLRKTRAPSILIENGYMTTPDEFLQVRKPENQKLFAKSLSNSIFMYFYPDRPLPELEEETETPDSAKPVQ